ncbi:TOM1-like protein 6 isoform X2 [Panicum hallii]|uniref:TOM1-like protein 6 isoform X2 n=1 Tax=Panicum hallii TaxID=206008 RepID=UPI000DF4CB31|nr:TOM1-like protein 6 isoform X2 [Panicum hallii]
MAAVRVDKATNELLLGPDWTLNIDICDAVNSDHGDSNKELWGSRACSSHRAQYTGGNDENCEEKDMQVRDKILTLLDSWQEAFGGPGGKHPHYYWAYAELKRSGVEFPKRSPDAAPIFTPPVTHPASLPSYLQAGYGMLVNSSSRLDVAMSSNGASLSMLDLERMLGAVELLSEMLRAVDPNDHDAVNDEIITELVNQCRSDQKKVLSLVSSLRDEELLGQALDLNDKLQILLEKHDAMVSGSPLPAEVTDVVSELSVGTTPNLGQEVAPTAAVAPKIVSTNVLNYEEEDEDDEFSLLARRNSRFRPTNSENASSSLGTSSSTIHEGIPSSEASVPSTTSSSIPSNALSPPDPPAPVRTSLEDQVMSDLLALTISSNSSPPYTPVTPEPALNQGGSTVSGYPQPYHVNQGHASAHYVAPWAQPQSQTATIQQQTSSPSHLPYNSLAYPPPPWASHDSIESNPFVVASSQHQSSSNSPINVPPNLRPLQQSHSFAVPLRTASLDSPINRNLKQPLSAGARRPSYVSSNKFFDDLFDRNSDGSLKLGSTVGSSTSSPYKAQ